MKINHRLKSLLGIVLAGLVVWSPLFAESRTWTSAEGKKVTGEQVGVDLTKQTMQLKTADGKIFTLPLASLSKDDATLARAWKYPPEVIISYETKVIESVSVQALMHVQNTSKSAHNYAVLCYFVPASALDDTNVEARGASFIIKNSITLNPYASTDADFADDKLGGFRPPGSSSQTTNRWLVFTDKINIEGFAIIVLSKDDSNFLAIKGADLTVETYVRKNLQKLLKLAPKDDPDPAP
jgi:hypothetical protein